MTSDQIILIGFVATLITFLLRVLASYLHYRPGRIVLSIVLYLVSFGLAFVWYPVTWPAFPPFGDVLTFVLGLWQWINDLIAVAAPIVGSATLIYNLLYSKVVVPLWTRLAKR